ncbi:hypothetical protein M0R45_006184 [Rubus argutus]|uniref:NADP-dependent oxidoreductase domain-containing protein n=1 Tax=Rubus argutus TaxID=59490 RepID=A0AAW1YQ61_RUBAR
MSDIRAEHMTDVGVDHMTENTKQWHSCVGFGASPLGNFSGPVSDYEANGSVRQAVRLVINFLDTSPYYGVTLSEKCGGYAEGFDFSADRVTKSIGESLERLQLDYVDILQCHEIEFGNLDQIFSGTIPALQKLKKQGRSVSLHPSSPELKSVCQAAALYCKERGTNISKLAMLYSSSNKNISSVLVGMNSIKQVKGNVAAAGGAFNSWERLSKLYPKAILKPVKNQTWPSGTQQS